MEDKRIVELYWERSEHAIAETASKYGAYCFSIARRILESADDAEECVNETYFGAWNSIPPHRPKILSAFLGKITRRTALKRRQKENAAKRGGGEIALVLEELEECIPSGQNVERQVEMAELSEYINAFVRSLPTVEQQVFICRYWYMDPVAEICQQFGFSQSKVKSMLQRTRHKLQVNLKKEGVSDER